MARNYVALPHEYLEEMDILSDAEFGRLCRALLKYSMTGEEAQLQGAEKVSWRRVKNQEDRFQESYNELAKSRQEAGKKGAAKRWQAMANDGKAMANDGKNGYTETKTETNTITLPPNGGKGIRARDSRDLIFLDDAQYSALIADLGEQETRRCIDYLSEYCSTHGKRYNDWPAVIRKASREQWGVKNRGQASASTEDFQPDVDRIRKNNDWLDKFLEEQEGKGGGQT